VRSQFSNRGRNVGCALGSKDAMLDSQETRERVQRHVWNASITYIENAGHILPAQTATVTQFLKGVRSVEEVASPCPS
jgi:hypothetical protein